MLKLASGEVEHYILSHNPFHTKQFGIFLGPHMHPLVFGRFGGGLVILPCESVLEP